MSGEPISGTSESTWNIQPDVVGAGIWFDVLPEREAYGRVASRFAVELGPLLAGEWWQAALDHAVANPYDRGLAGSIRPWGRPYGRLVCPMATGETRRDAWSADLTEDTWQTFLDRVARGQTWAVATVARGQDGLRMLLRLHRAEAAVMKGDFSVVHGVAPNVGDRTSAQVDEVASAALEHVKATVAELPAEPAYAAVDRDSEDGQTSAEAVLRYDLEWDPTLLRGYSWASYLNAAVVERVGGRAVIEESGAFWSVESGPFEGGLWVQACERHSQFGRAEAARMFEVLAPALPAGKPRVATTRPDALIVMRDAASHPGHPEHAAWLAAQAEQSAPNAG